MRAFRLAFPRRENRSVTTFDEPLKGFRGVLLPGSNKEKASLAWKLITEKVNNYLLSRDDTLVSFTVFGAASSTAKLFFTAAKVKGTTLFAYKSLSFICGWH